MTPVYTTKQTQWLVFRDNICLLQANSSLFRRMYTECHQDLTNKSGEHTDKVSHTHTHRSAQSTHNLTIIINLFTNGGSSRFFVWDWTVVKKHRKEEQIGKEQGKSAAQIRKRHEDGQGAETHWRGWPGWNWSEENPKHKQINGTAGQADCKSSSRLTICIKTMNCYYSQQIYSSSEPGKFDQCPGPDFYVLACVGVWELYCLLCRQDTQFSREKT